MFMKPITTSGALTLLLNRGSLAAVSQYDIGILLFRLYTDKTFDGNELKGITKPVPDRSTIKRNCNTLYGNGIFEIEHNLPRNTFLVSSAKYKDPADIVCSLDPFCYVSHLSALEYHGLTDVMTKTLFVTTLPANEWTERALQRMKRDLRENFDAYIDAELPKLQRHTIKSLGKTHVNKVMSKTAGSYINVNDRSMRVSSIARTFLDSLRRPDLCGGINQVIDAFEDHAKPFLSLILDEIDNHADPLEKVRAGYILEERCGIKDNSRINAWAAFAQRGGSRRLDPNESYWPEFSEKWMISLNVSR
jgi:predicted transcriptional regulator of viral defense system